MSLLSFKDNYENMRQKIDLNECVQVGNPKTLEFEQVRTSLIPGLLKTLKENKNEPIPQKVFEISDCVVLDQTTDTGAKNIRKIAALNLDMNSNFEVIHGLLDLLMGKIYAQQGVNYKLVEDNEDPRFFPTRGASVMLNGKRIGSVGVLHPEVLKSFDLTRPVSCFEIDFPMVFD